MKVLIASQTNVVSHLCARCQYVWPPVNSACAAGLSAGQRRTELRGQPTHVLLLSVLTVYEFSKNRQAAWAFRPLHCRTTPQDRTEPSNLSYA